MTPAPVWQLNTECSKVKLPSAPNLLAKVSPTSTACACPVYDKTPFAVFGDNAEQSMEARHSGKDVHEFVEEDQGAVILAPMMVMK